MKKNAIIMAAGKSNTLAPFTYEKPKGLFIIKGEVLIERQIEQLIEAGVNEIIIVIGYMKEKFFYLEEKYPQVKFVTNNTYGTFGNIYSLYVAREYLKNTFICCADQYFLENPFIDDNEYNQSYRACAFHEGNFREFSIKTSDINIITECKIGGTDNMAMFGHGYFNENFSKLFVKFLEEEIDEFGVTSMFWEEFYGKHIRDLSLFMKEYKKEEILEFDSINDLRLFDSDFLLNIDSEIVGNICTILDCHPNEIKDIEIVKAGLTNASFKFTVKGKEYIYRHPGGSADNIINRQSELYIQYQAKEFELDKSLIHMDISGWKISHFIQNIVPVNILEDEKQLEQLMEYLRRTQEIPNSDEVKYFDNIIEANKLITLACKTKGNLYKEFEELFSKVYEIDELVKKEREKYGIEFVISHHDVYEPNFIFTGDGDFYLIDWEFASLNDPINDVCSIFTRHEYTDEQRDYMLEKFYGRKLTDLEYKHAMGHAILNAYYWISWPLFKGSIGEEDGFFFLSAYRYLVNHVDEVLEMYKEI